MEKFGGGILPEFSHEQPSSVQVAAVATSLPFLVAREQMLRAEEDAVGTLAHHGESVRGDLRRGNGPRSAAPTLIVHARDLPPPTCPGVEFPRQGLGIVHPPHRIHSVNLCSRSDDWKGSSLESNEKKHGIVLHSLTELDGFRVPRRSFTPSDNLLPQNSE